MSQFTEIIIWVGGGLCLIIGSLIAFVIARFVGNITDVKTELNSFRKEIVSELKLMNESLHIIDRDLRGRIFDVDKRVTKIETEHEFRGRDGC